MPDKWKDRVKNRLKTKRLFQLDLAAHLGVTAPAVSQYLSGKREPTIKQIREIASMLDMSLSELLGDDATFIVDKNQIRAAELIKEMPAETAEMALKILESLVPEK